MAADEAQNGQGASSDSRSTAELVQHLSQFDGQPQDFLVNLLAVQCRIASAGGGFVKRVTPTPMTALTLRP